MGPKGAYTSSTAQGMDMSDFIEIRLRKRNRFARVIKIYRAYRKLGYNRRAALWWSWHSFWR